MNDETESGLNDNIASGMDADAVRQAVERLGATEVEVDSDRLAAVEQRIIHQIETGDGARGVVLPLRRRRSLLGSVAAACVIGLMIVVVSLLVVGSDDSVVIAAGEGVVVTLPDGTEVDGVAGTELPDGSRLDVAGFVEVDDERFGPGAYVVRNGRLGLTDDGEAPRSTVDDRTEGTARVVPPEDEEPPSSGTVDDRTEVTQPTRTTTPASTAPEADRPTSTQLERVPEPTRAPVDSPTRPTTTVADSDSESDGDDVTPPPTRPPSTRSPVSTTEAPVPTRPPPTTAVDRPVRDRPTTTARGDR